MVTSKYILQVWIFLLWGFGITLKLAVPTTKDFAFPGKFRLAHTFNG